MDCIVHGVAKSREQMNDFHFIFIQYWEGGSMGEERGEGRRGEEMERRNRTSLGYEENCTLIYVKH